MGDDNPYIAKLRVLWTEWDPLGVMHIDGVPEDEYDFYLQPTLSRLADGLTEDELTEFLATLTETMMEVSREYTKPRVFAKKLLEWWSHVMETTNM